MPPYLTYLIASPSAIVREGLKVVLQPEADLYWVGDAATTDEVLARVRDLHVDLLLLDLDLLDDASQDLLARLRQEAAETKVVALADSWNDTRIVAALRNGVHGFIVRRSTVNEIVEAMRAAQSGSLVLHPSATELLMQQLQPP
jgi:DNA-binding NarL/FixJ family response regulator